MNRFRWVYAQDLQSQRHREKGKKRKRKKRKKKLNNENITHLMRRPIISCIFSCVLVLILILLNNICVTGGQSFEDSGLQNIDSNSSNQKPKLAPNLPNTIVASKWQDQLYLPCQFENLDTEDQTVSWIRKRDSLVLTIDKLKLIDDTRFSIAPANGDWTLILNEPKDFDAGFYECQVSSMEPKLSHLVELQMVEARSWIRDVSKDAQIRDKSNINRKNSKDNFDGAIFIRPNEALNVTCTIEAPQKTDFVYWYKNKIPIKYDHTVSKELKPNKYMLSATSYSHPNKGPDSSHTNQANESDNLIQQDKQEPKIAMNLVRSSSNFVIKQAHLNDTANYTCSPSNAQPSHINIIVVSSGAQSQPEKRSLQAVDSSHSLGPEMILHRIWLRLVDLLAGTKPKPIRTLQPLPSVISEQTWKSLIVETSKSPDTYRLLITSSMVLLLLQ